MEAVINFRQVLAVDTTDVIEDLSETTQDCRVEKKIKWWQKHILN